MTGPIAAVSLSVWCKIVLAQYTWPAATSRGSESRPTPVVRPLTEARVVIFLPVASANVNVLLLVGIGAAVGIVQGMLGSGGFLLTPLLIMLGISPTVAAASGVNAIAGASVSGTLRHLRASHVDLKLGMLMLAGGVAGGGVGTFLVKLLRALGDLDVVIVLCYVVLMAVIGVTMFVGGLTSQVRGETVEVRATAIHRFLRWLPLQARFEIAGTETSALAPILLGGVVGALAAIMGVGGGFLLVPAMAYFFAIPMPIIVGTCLFQMLFTTASVTLFQAAVNHNVDALLAAFLLVGSTLGAQVGALAVKHLKESQLRLAFSMLVLTMSLKFFNDLLQPPVAFLAILSGHR
jgi:uncharacterized protein